MPSKKPPPKIPGPKEAMAKWLGQERWMVEIRHLRDRAIFTGFSCESGREMFASEFDWEYEILPLQ